MWRWLAYTVCGVCLLLALASAVFWVRSYWWQDRIAYTHERGPYVDLSADTKPEAAILYLNVPLAPDIAEPGWLVSATLHRTMPPSIVPQAYPAFSGDFKWRSYKIYGDRTTWMLECPFWALLAVCIPVGLVSAVPWGRRACRRRLGLCEKCGYDLRASPERCPECGTPRPNLRRPSTYGEAPDATA